MLTSKKFFKAKFIKKNKISNLKKLQLFNAKSTKSKQMN